MNTLLNPPVGGRYAPELFRCQWFLEGISEEPICNHVETTLEGAMWLLRRFDVVHLETEFFAR